jgi:hypothetical protein
MTPSVQAGGASRLRTRKPVRPTWPRVLVIVGVLILAFVVARACQNDQVRITKEQAIAAARDEVDFTAERVNVRLLRQGLDSKPYWFVNLSIPGREEGSVTRLAVVKINANTGEVTEVMRQR